MNVRMNAAVESPYWTTEQCAKHLCFESRDQARRFLLSKGLTPHMRGRTVLFLREEAMRMVQPMPVRRKRARRRS